MYIEDLYKKEGIILLDRKKALLKGGLAVWFAAEQSAFCFYDGEVMGNEVYIGQKIKHKEAAMWHEIGHIKHPLGSGKDRYPLTKELAANTYALANYEGDAAKEDIIHYLSVWIKTYIDDGYIKAKDDEELKQTARILGIFDSIIWE
jgi:hypothetical protein